MNSRSERRPWLAVAPAEGERQRDEQGEREVKREKKRRDAGDE